MIDTVSPALLVVFILAFFSWYIAFVLFTTRVKYNKSQKPKEL